MKIKKNKRAIQILAGCTALFISFAVFTELKFDLSIWQYIEYSMPISQREKAYMEEKETLVYGSDQNAPPLSFVNQVTGEYQGLIVDYMSSISIELGIPVAANPLVWHNTMEELKKGTIDVVDLFPSEEREQDFTFSQSIYSLRGAVAVKGNKIKSISDLDGRSVAVENGDFAIEYFKKSVMDEQNVQCRLIGVKDIKEGLELLKNGDVDAVAGDDTVIDYYLSKDQGNKESHLLDSYLYEKEVTLAVDKDQKTLLSILNKAILQLKKKDVLANAQEKWFGISAPIIKRNRTYNIGLMVVVMILTITILLAVWNDLMKKKIWEKTEALEINKRNLHTIIDALDDYLLVLDKDKNIVECNTAAEKLLGDSKENILSSHISSYKTASDLYEAQPADNEPLHYCGRYYAVTKHDLASNLQDVLVVIDDVTEKMIFERQVRQDSKMIAIGHLSAGLAHEIRNPLGLIRNYLYVLRSKTNDEVGNHAIDVASESVMRINGLITNLLNFSRISGCEIETLDMAALIKEIIQLEAKKLNEKNISVQFEGVDQAEIRTKKESVKTIFINLAANAIDALEAGKDNKIVFDFRWKGDRLMIRITDNGRGMNENALENIFNAFFTTKKSGTGLGLYIVRTELGKIGGEIDVKSTEGIGTSFTILLPDDFSKPKDTDLGGKNGI